ncbi:hypothetical protein CDAR_97581 [Caerostris darwini]|uniref:Uncharacterized protein n=1 Tax=Caerostris darwini TaxID=1538125 RepID=A0AAV4S7W1_9ARAC|nr:hypothetical protein CDAR_97581 [Caerostris darwini]
MIFRLVKKQYHGNYANNKLPSTDPLTQSTVLNNASVKLFNDKNNNSVLFRRRKSKQNRGIQFNTPGLRLMNAESARLEQPFLRRHYASKEGLLCTLSGRVLIASRLS